MEKIFASKNLQLAIFIETFVYAFIGVAVFAVSIWVMEKLSPFSIRKEIEEDQNVALGIIMGSIIIGLAIVLASVLK